MSDEERKKSPKELIQELPASERIERTVKCDACGWYTPGVPQAESWALHVEIARLAALLKEYMDEVF